MPHQPIVFNAVARVSRCRHTPFGLTSGSCARSGPRRRAGTAGTAPHQREERAHLAHRMSQNRLHDHFRHNHHARAVHRVATSSKAICVRVDKRQSDQVAVVRLRKGLVRGVRRPPPHRPPTLVGLRPNSTPLAAGWVAGWLYARSSAPAVPTAGRQRRRVPISSANHSRRQRRPGHRCGRCTPGPTAFALLATSRRTRV